MQAENLSINEGGEREIVEEVSEVLPHIRIPVFAQTLVVESVNLRDLSRLMIATENSDSFTVSDFQSDKKRHRFNRVIAAIDVISHEQIVCVW